MTDTIQIPPIGAGIPRMISLSGNLTLSTSDIAGKSIACFGTTGSGKSTTARRMIEQCLRAGMPFSVADIEDEYYGLKEMGEIILAGPQDHGEARVDVVIRNEKQMHTLAQKAYTEGRSVVLMLGDLDEETRRLFLAAYEDGLFVAGANVETRRPHLLVLEEAHEYVPQTGIPKNDALFIATMRLAKRGRKRGIFLMLVSQRPANINKDVLTQCQIFLMHWVSYKTDIDTYKSILPMSDLEAKLGRMKAGDIFFMHGKQLLETHVALPHSKSPSATPGASPNPNSFIGLRDAQAIQHELEEANDHSGLTVIDGNELKALRDRLAWLENHNQELLRGNTTELMERSLHEQEAFEKKLAELQRRADKAEALTMPVTLLLAQHQNKGDA